MDKLKITVIKKFDPKIIFGHNILRTSTEKPIPPCFLEEGREFLVDNHLSPPKDFCEQAWHDIYETLMIYYYGGDYEYPEPGFTYIPCNDGIRPVIFKIEKL
ncbi:TIGR04076 family protein [Candidatus Hodarchaeum mangrovi]